MYDPNTKYSYPNELNPKNFLEQGKMVEEFIMEELTRRILEEIDYQIMDRAFAQMNQE